MTFVPLISFSIPFYFMAFSLKGTPKRRNLKGRGKKDFHTILCHLGLIGGHKEIENE